MRRGTPVRRRVPAKVRLRVPVGSGRHVGVGSTPALEAAAEAGEPASTLVAGALRAGGWRQVVLTVEDHPGAVLGAVVVERHGRSRWEARPLVVDAGCAPLLARIVHLSPTRRVMGVGPHVAPLVAHLPRTRTVGRSAFYGAADKNAVPPSDLDPRSRAATPADLPALVALFADTYHLGRSRDRAAWTRLLRRTTAEGLVVVAEVDGRVVGGLLCGAVSRVWAFGTDAVIGAEHRGLGLSWAMANRMFALVLAYGLDMCGAQVDENPMDADRHYVDHEALTGELWGVGLDPHLRAVRRVARRVRRAGAL